MFNDDDDRDNLGFRRRQQTPAELEAVGRSGIAWVDAISDFVLGLFGIQGKTAAQQKRATDEEKSMVESAERAEREMKIRD